MKTVILGGNPGGMACAARLGRRAPDADIVVFEKTGEVSYGACGLPYYVGGENDDLDKMRIRKAAAFIESGIDLRLYHEAVDADLDAKTVTLKNLATGQSFVESFDNLVVATGASPVFPPVEGAELALPLKTLADGERLKSALDGAKRVVIIGGGYIGLETAEAVVRRGCKLTLIEAAPRLLTGFDAEFSQGALEACLRAGVEVRCGERAQKITPSCVTTDGGEYPADLVIMSVGVRPNTAFLRGQLETLPNGAIITDSKMRTSRPCVYAAGDCSTVIQAITGKPAYLPLGTNANKQGRVLADVLSGADVSLPPALGSAMLRCFDLELAKTGLTVDEAARHGVDAASVTVKAGSHARYYPGAAELTVKLTYRPDTKVLLGGQLMGAKECALRIDIIALAVDRGMTARELGLADLAYAPPFAGVWDAVQQAANVIK